MKFSEELKIDSEVLWNLYAFLWDGLRIRMNFSD